MRRGGLARALQIAIATSFTIVKPSLAAAAETILEAPHHSPAAFNASDPIVLFCIQAGLVIIFSRLLAVVLGRLRQPKVISEVLAGIIL